MAPKTPVRPNLPLVPKSSRKNGIPFARAKKPIVAPITVSGSLESMGPIDYQDIQIDEIEALRAIFMDDYQEVEVKAAWNTQAERAFRLKLQAFADPKTSVILSVKLTATYPKSPPILEVDGLNGLHATSRDRILNLIKTKPAELAGGAMIHDIATDIQDVLEDAVMSREQGVLPSLEEERIIQESAAEQHAKAVEADEIKRKEAATAEADRLQQEMVMKEMNRLQKRQDAVQRSSEVQSPTDDHFTRDDELRFDQVVSLAPLTDSPDFNTVALISTITHKGAMRLFTAKPRPHSHSHTNADLLVIRQVRLTLPSGDNASWESLLELEGALADLKAIRHPNIINLYAFKIERTEADGETASQDRLVSVLTDLANRGSLAEMLEDGQTLPLHRVRQWSLDLLDALENYHFHATVHRRIHASNILISRSASGLMVPRLSDAAYEDRLLRLQGRPSTIEKGRKMLAWLAPETVADHKCFTRKTDIWDFGVVLIQMLFGVGITRKHSSPYALMDALDLSDPLDAVLRKIFNKDGKERPTAFDLIPSEFFRGEAPIMASDQSTSRRRRPSSSHDFTGPKSPIVRRSRQNSQSTTDIPIFHPSSRYLNEFVEQGRLGKGGFGEVVKARNKTDNSFYAIKKVKQESAEQLQQVLSEVILLSRLNNPYVVRYHAAWVEDEVSEGPNLDEDSMTESFTSSAGQDVEFGMSSRGLDFASSQGYDDIVFGDDSSEEDEEDDFGNGSGTDTGTETKASYDDGITFEQSAEDSQEDSDLETSPSAPLEKTRSGSRRIARSTLYIQMEYCEKRTLRDLIRRDMYEKPQDAWQMLRHILEGLAHIHTSGIIHRDLKPDNVFIDKLGNPRIGDFGLATTSRTLAPDKLMASTNTAEDMTRSIGTALYVAPEVKTGTGNYNDKVDMYSLGIIFFEMCYPLKTAMERHHVLMSIRERSHVLPAAFQEQEKLLQADVIMSMIKHSPGERPSSSELLRSGKLPLQMEDETIRRTLQSMVDSGSHYYQKMMTTLFAQTEDQRIRGLAWDARARDPVPSPEDLRVRDIAKDVVHTIFRSHGAEETHRPVIFDRSNYYTAPNVVQLLDINGNLLQLPFDLTLPHARQLAKQVPTLPVDKTFVFGHVYREAPSGGPPWTIGLVDFNIVAHLPRDNRLHEAECMKVVEEIIDTIPALSSTPICFYLAHSDLLEIILDYCRIDKAQRPIVRESLSKLNIRQFDWAKVRAELRSPLLGIHSTSLDELAQFNFRETPEKIHDKLQLILEGSVYASRIGRPLEQIMKTIEQMKLLGITKKVYVCPLSCYNERFYSGSVLFQCIFDKKSKTMFAAGGRYDSLIDAHRPRGPTEPKLCHAVGVSMLWDTLVSSILRHRKDKLKSMYLKKGAEDHVSPIWNAKRVSLARPVPWISF